MTLLAAISMAAPEVKLAAVLTSVTRQWTPCWLITIVDDVEPGAEIVNWQLWVWAVADAAPKCRAAMIPSSDRAISCVAVRISPSPLGAVWVGFSLAGERP